MDVLSRESRKNVLEKRWSEEWRWRKKTRVMEQLWGNGGFMEDLSFLDSTLRRTLRLRRKELELMVLQQAVIGTCKCNWGSC